MHECTHASRQAGVCARKKTQGVRTYRAGCKVVVGVERVGVVVAVGVVVFAPMVVNIVAARALPVL